MKIYVNLFEIKFDLQRNRIHFICFFAFIQLFSLYWLEKCIISVSSYAHCKSQSLVFLYTIHTTNQQIKAQEMHISKFTTLCRLFPAMQFCLTSNLLLISSLAQISVHRKTIVKHAHTNIQKKEIQCLLCWRLNSDYTKPISESMA